MDMYRKYLGRWISGIVVVFLNMVTILAHAGWVFYTDIMRIQARREEYNTEKIVYAVDDPCVIEDPIWKCIGDMVEIQSTIGIMMVALDTISASILICALDNIVGNCGQKPSIWQLQSWAVIQLVVVTIIMLQFVGQLLNYVSWATQDYMYIVIAWKFAAITAVSTWAYIMFRRRFPVEECKAICTPDVKKVADEPCLETSV